MHNRLTGAMQGGLHGCSWWSLEETSGGCVAARSSRKSRSAGEVGGLAARLAKGNTDS
jgi:hypothetical protein